MGVLSLRRQILMAQPHKEKIVGTNGIATFDTDFKAPMKVVIPFEPVQEGTGDPSPDNVRPISGWNVTTIFQSGGENIVDVSNAKPWAKSTNTIITIDSGTNSVNVRSTTESTYKACEIMPLPSFIAGKTYVLEADVIVNSGAAMFGARRRSNNSYLGNANGSIVFMDGAIHNGPITDHQEHHIVVSITPNETFADNSLAICGLCSYSAAAYGNVSYNNIKYYEYGDTLPIAFTDPTTGDPLTVYGGTVTLNEDGSADVISTHCIYDIPSTQWTYSSGATCWYITRASLNPKWDISGSNQDNVIRDIVCSAYKTETYNHTTHQSYAPCIAERRYNANWIAVQTGSANVRPVDCQVKMKLATPITYHFPNVGQLKSFLGQNNIWSDLNGDPTVTFWKHG